MGIWTVDSEFDQHVRHVDLNRSGGSFFAVFTLRLIPDLECHAVSFASRIHNEEAIPWLPSIQEGIRGFQEQRADERRPIGFLRIELVAITIHPVDSKGYRFKQAAIMAMSKAFETHGLEL